MKVTYFQFINVWKKKKTFFWNLILRQIFDTSHMLCSNNCIRWPHNCYLRMYSLWPITERIMVENIKYNTFYHSHVPVLGSNAHSVGALYALKPSNHMISRSFAKEILESCVNLFSSKPLITQFSSRQPRILRYMPNPSLFMQRQSKPVWVWHKATELRLNCFGSTYGQWVPAQKNDSQFEPKKEKRKRNITEKKWRREASSVR